MALSAESKSFTLQPFLESISVIASRTASSSSTTIIFIGPDSSEITGCNFNLPLLKYPLSYAFNAVFTFRNLSVSLRYSWRFNGFRVPFSSIPIFST